MSTTDLVSTLCQLVISKADLEKQLEQYSVNITTLNKQLLGAVNISTGLKNEAESAQSSLAEATRLYDELVKTMAPVAALVPTDNAPAPPSGNKTPASPSGNKTTAASSTSNVLPCGPQGCRECNSDNLNTQNHDKRCLMCGHCYIVRSTRIDAYTTINALCGCIGVGNDCVKGLFKFPDENYKCCRLDPGYNKCWKCR
jgi:hypothetical protein